MNGPATRCHEGRLERELGGTAPEAARLAAFADDGFAQACFGIEKVRTIKKASSGTVIP